MNHHNIKDVKENLIEVIHSNFDWYKDIEFKLIIVKQLGKNILYRGKDVFRHNSAPDDKDVTYDYGNVQRHVRSNLITVVQIGKNICNEQYFSTG